MSKDYIKWWRNLECYILLNCRIKNLHLSIDPSQHKLVGQTKFTQGFCANCHDTFFKFMYIDQYFALKVLFQHQFSLYLVKQSNMG